MVEKVLEVIQPKSSLEPECFEDMKNAFGFVCTICSEVPNPHTAVEETLCGHLFCDSCLKIWLLSKSKCPDCNSSITNTQRPLKSDNKILYRLLMEMVVHCPTGCLWTGPWNNLDKHLEDCDNAVVKCKYQCNRKEMRKDIERHETNECPNRPTRCAHCEQRFKFSEIESHESKCKNNEMAMRPCRLKYLGCKFRGKLDERKEHEASQAAYHLELAEIHIEKLSKTAKEGDEVKFELGAYYNVSVHSHMLQYVNEDNGWACDGMRLAGRCKSGITGFRQTAGMLRFRCKGCDFDLCDKCLKTYIVKK
eukprot:TRINITY_DN4584_c0_g1_i3.p1 TRINITY_DN4584_c0_g1~~TRINITY_DN4584_c0_g1_i3.p1  ORF type:complete len:307 (+),score=37.88 TRINITY_DN4584_c0_g1_i3:125-1045(+)